MPVLKVKNDNGVWQDIATAYTHAHTVSDITDLPASLVDDVEALKDKVGAHSVAYQVSTAVEANNYTHPETHPASMITGLSDIAITGSYNDLKDLPEAPDIEDYATKTYVQEEIAKINVSGGTGGDGTGNDGSTIVSAVQPDWNQTDDTQMDFIKNKPFGEYEGLVDILPLTQYDDFYLDSNFGVYAKATTTTYILTIGETYTVYWDENEYECVAQDASVLVDGAVVLGNASNFGLSGNNEPFIIACVAAGSQYFSLIDTEAGNSHRVRICQDGIAIKKIDPKYLDSPDWNENDKTSGSYIANRPFYTLSAGTVIVPETTVNCGEVYVGDVYYAVIDEPNIGIHTYNVEFDGVIYELTGDSDIENGVNATVVLTGKSEDGNELFIIAKGFNGDNDINLLLSTQGEHTFKITLAEDDIQKIDPIYIPEIDALPEVTTDDNGKTLVVSEGAWSVTEPVKGVPEVTSSDAGKFLRVSADGFWVAETVLNAEEVKF